MFDFGLTDEQRAIQETARGHLGRRRDAWEEIVELGWPAVLVDQESGGLGLGVSELVLITAELGYAASPLPLISGAVTAALVNAAGHDEVLSRLLLGEARATIAIADDAGNPVDERMHGEKILVPDPAGADYAVALIGGAELVLVNLRDVGVAVAEQQTLDPTRTWGRITLDGPTPSSMDVPSERRVALLSALDVALAADSVGVARRSLDLAVAYANDRRQFGRAIGSFQGVAYRCSQMLLELQGAETVTWSAARALDRRFAGAERAAAAAKSYASDAGWRVASSSLQVHGAVGYTTEHEINRMLGRGRVNAQCWTGAAQHREKVAAALL